MGKIITMKVPLAAIVVGLLVIPFVRSDDFLLKPKNSLQIHSETVLSGIDIDKDTIEQAIGKLGKPRNVTIKPRTDVYPSVGIYEWETKACSLRITALNDSVSRKTSSAYSLPIASVDVVGSSPEAGLCSTGRGLKLGATMSDARRIYAPFRSTVSENAPILQIDFDKAGKVHHMKLTNQCVPFCF